MTEAEAPGALGAEERPDGAGEGRPRRPSWSSIGEWTVSSGGSYLSERWQQGLYPLNRIDTKEKFNSKIRRSASAEVRLDTDDALVVHSDELLRAVPFSRILSRRGWKVMAGSQGGEATFQMSRPVKCMNMFVSHSWMTPGWLKMICLMFELNHRRAVAAAVAAHFLVHGLEIVGLWEFPIPPSAHGFALGGDRLYPSRWQLHYVIAGVVFFAVLRWGQAAPIGEIDGFLDKCCIHQTDAAKKAEGIKQLGAFLRQSEYLLVLWQPEYFTRLWCVYEVAAFSYIYGIHASDRILIRPLKLSCCTVALCIFHFVASVSLTVLTPLILFSRWHSSWVLSTMPDEVSQVLYMFVTTAVMLFFGLYFVPGFLLWRFCKWHMHDRRTLLQQLSGFSLANVECREASDRAFVFKHIAEWFGTPEMFESYVRNDLYRQVEGLLLRQGPIPYKMILVGYISHVLITSTQLVICWEDGVPELFWRFILVGSMISFCTDAIAVNLVLRLADTSFGDDIESRPWFQRELAGPLMTAGIFTILTAVATCCLSPVVPLWVAIVMLLMQASWVLACFRPARHASALASTESRVPEEMSSSFETGNHGDSSRLGTTADLSFRMGGAEIPEVQPAPQGHDELPSGAGPLSSV